MWIDKPPPIMGFPEVRDRLEQKCEFPVEQATVVECVGDVELDGHTGEPETVETVLERTEQTTYRSAEEVHTTLLGTVDDDYVGQKYYDDRAGARSVPHVEAAPLV